MTAPRTTGTTPALGPGTEHAGTSGPATAAPRTLADIELREMGGLPDSRRSRRSRRGASRRDGSRRRWALLGAVAVLLALVAAVWQSLRDSDRVIRSSGLTQVREFFVAAAQPDLDPDFLRLTADAALTTLAYALLGTALSIVIGVLGGALSAHVWWRLGGRRTHLSRRARLTWHGTRVAMVVPRGIHEVVWGLFLLAILGIEPIVAVLAIGIPFGAITAKVFAEILDDVDPRAADALIASGAGRTAAFCYGVLPVALGNLVSYGFYRLDCAIRSAAILGLIGAGGLGFQLQLSFQSLRYEQIWTLLYALVILTLAADAWGSTVRRRLARVGAHGTVGTDRVLQGSLLVAALGLPLCAWWIDLSLDPLVDGRSWELAGELLSASLPPTLGAGESGAGGSGAGGFTGLLVLSWETLVISVLAIVLAFLGGLLLAAPAARPQTPGAGAARWGVSLLTRLLLVVLRAIPPPIWALIALFVLAPGILPGAVALGIYTAGVLGRLMAETLENLDRRPLTALRAQGAGAAQAFAYGVLPAASPRFVGYGFYRWEVTIRETVIVGVVGAGGLGMLLQTQLALFDYGGAMTTIWSILALTLLVDLASSRLRRVLA